MKKRTRITNEDVARQIVRVLTRYAASAECTLSEASLVHLCGEMVCGEYHELRDTDPSDWGPRRYARPLPERRIEAICDLVEEMIETTP